MSIKSIIEEIEKKEVLEGEPERFSQFCQELEALSKKYGVAIASTGGVAFGEIDSIQYVDDFTSGDLYYNIDWAGEQE